MFNTKAFGAHLLAKRKKANMTQLELAEKLNLTRQAISKYETGESFPDISIVIKMAETFGTTIDELVHPSGVTSLMQPEAKERFIENLLAEAGEVDLQLLQAALPYIEDMAQLLEAAIFEGALPQNVSEILNEYWRKRNANM